MVLKKDNNNRDKGFELQVQGTLTQDKAKISSVFNTYFIDSVQDLAKNFGPREKNITPPNDNLPLFNISEVTEPSVVKTTSQFKNSKAKDVFDCDCAFVRKYKNIPSTPITHLVNLSVKHVFFPHGLEVSSDNSCV